MPKVTSNDGSVITYDKRGQGPVLIQVLGALNKRGRGKKLADLLADRFTVISYDRRGRGDSTEVLPYSPTKEVEDLVALIDELGGKAYLYGHSSGSILCLLAAKKLGNKVEGMAIYEAPYNDDPAALKDFQVYKKALTKAVADNKPEVAVSLFIKLVGVSDKQLAALQKLPMWRGLTDMAHTLIYDTVELMEQYPKIDVASIKTHTLVMYGAKSHDFMRHTATKIAEAMPNAKLQAVEGQDHDVKAEALAPMLTSFFE